MASERGYGVGEKRRWGVGVPLLWMLVCVLGGGLVPALAAESGPPGVAEPFDLLTLLTPSDVGGADSTARAMKQVLEEQGIARAVRIQHITDSRHPGQSAAASADVLLLGDMSMLGEAISSHALPAFNELRPIAELTSDADVVVVPAASPYRNLDDLLEAMRRNPRILRWAGESVGGSDHPVMWQLARAAGVLPELLRYQSFRGGREVAAQLLGGQFNAAIAGYTVFQSAIVSGRLRGLAIVSRQPIDGVSIPTFRQLGLVGVSIANWCGAFALPGTSNEQRARLAAAVQRMAQSPGWPVTLGQFHLRGAYRAATDFSLLVRQEQTRMVKAQSTQSIESYLRFWTVLWEYRLEWMVAIWGGAGLLLGALCWQKLAAQRREQRLARTLQGLVLEVERRTQEVASRTQDMAAIRAGMNAQIEREFARWQLTPAERSVAHLMLKGLRLKGIAQARNTSERTVRQQAQSIYGKAGLEGRSDLAAYFLEAVLGAPELEPPAPV